MPVRLRSPWLLLLAAVIAIIIIIGAFLAVTRQASREGAGDRPVDLQGGPPEARRPAGEPRPVPREREPITALAPLLDAPVAGGLAGSVVALDDAPVHAVAGDHVCWIGTSPERRVPVKRY